MTNHISPANFDLVCVKTGEIIPWDCISWRRNDAEGRPMPERIVSAFEAYGSITRHVMVTVEQLDRETNARTGHFEVVPLAALNLHIVPSDSQAQTFEATEPTKENETMTTNTTTSTTATTTTIEAPAAKALTLDTSELSAADDVLNRFDDFENAVSEYNEALHAYHDARETLDTEVSALQDAIQEAMDEIDARLEPAETAREEIKEQIRLLQEQLETIDEQTKELDQKRAHLEQLRDGLSEPDGDEYDIQEGRSEFEDALDLSGICN